jgi:hypothetical protein
MHCALSGRTILLLTQTPHSFESWGSYLITTGSLAHRHRMECKNRPLQDHLDGLNDAANSAYRAKVVRGSVREPRLKFGFQKIDRGKCQRSRDQANDTLRRDRRNAKPNPAKPSNIIAQVAGSGTPGVTLAAPI